MANRVISDGPSHRDLFCLQSNLFWSTGLNGLNPTSLDASHLIKVIMESDRNSFHV